MRDWISHHFLLITVISVAACLVGVLAAVIVAVLLPADYFVRPSSHTHGMSLARKIAKNAVGGVLFVLGFLMALPLVPGPGLVFMLIGASMTDFPGETEI